MLAVTPCKHYLFWVTLYVPMFAASLNPQNMSTLHFILTRILRVTSTDCYPCCSSSPCAYTRRNMKIQEHTTLVLIKTSSSKPHTEKIKRWPQNSMNISLVWKAEPCFVGAKQGTSLRELLLMSRADEQPYSSRTTWWIAKSCLLGRFVP